MSKISPVKLYEYEGILNYRSDEKLNNNIVKFSFVEGKDYSSASRKELFFSLSKKELVDSSYEEKSVINPKVIRAENLIIGINGEERGKGTIEVFSDEMDRLWHDLIWGQDCIVDEESIIYWTADSLLNIYLVSKSIKNGETLWKKSLFNYVPLRLELEKIEDRKLIVSDQDEVCVTLDLSTGDLINDLSGEVEGNFTTCILPAKNEVLIFGNRLILYDIKVGRVVWSSDLVGLHGGYVPLIYQDKIIIPSENEIHFYYLETGQVLRKVDIFSSVDRLFKLYNDILFFDTFDSKFYMLDLSQI